MNAEQPCRARKVAEEDFGWIQGGGRVHGSCLDAWKALLICFRFAGKRMSGPVRAPIDTALDGKLRAWEQLDPNSGVRFEGPVRDSLRNSFSFLPLSLSLYPLLTLSRQDWIQAEHKEKGTERKSKSWLLT